MHALTHLHGVSVAELREELRLWYAEKARREAELKAEMDGDMDAEAERAFKLKNQRQEMQITLIGKQAAAVQDEVAEWENKFQQLKLVVGTTGDANQDEFTSEDIIQKYGSVVCCDVLTLWFSHLSAIIRYHAREVEMEQIDEQQNQLHRSIADLRNQQKKLTAQLRSVSQGQGVGYTAEYNREASDALDARGECKAARAAIRSCTAPLTPLFRRCAGTSRACNGQRGIRARKVHEAANHPKHRRVAPAHGNGGAEGACGTGGATERCVWLTALVQQPFPQSSSPLKKIEHGSLHWKIHIVTQKLWNLLQQMNMTVRVRGVFTEKRSAHVPWLWVSSKQATRTSRPRPRTRAAGGQAGVATQAAAAARAVEAGHALQGVATGYV